MSPSIFDSAQKSQSFSGCISYRPVTAATFFLDYALWKDNPIGHHLSNIFLHFLATVLVFYFVLKISADLKIAFLTASLFAVHPIQSEVLNSSSYRSDILLAIFYLSAILAYWRYCTTQKKIRWLIIIAVAYALALFSKETALTFPVAIFLIDRFFINGQSSRAVLQNKKVLYLALTGISLFYLYVYFFLIPNSFYMRPSTAAAAGMLQLVFILKIFAQYMSALFFPSSISVLPPLYAPTIFPLYVWEMFIALAVVLLSIVLAWYSFAQKRIITFAILWFYLNYFPVSGILALLNPLAYRFLYLPSIGFFILAAIFIRFLIRRCQQRNFSLNISVLVQGSLIGLLIALSVANNAFFKSNFTACREMIRRYPQSSRPYWILGLENYRAGNMPEAVKYLEQHLKVSLNNPFISSDKEKFLTYHLLGQASIDPDTAITYFKKADELFAGLPSLYLDLARNYLIKKDFSTALTYAQKAAQIDPQFVPAWVYQVHINIETGNLVAAASILSEAKKKFNQDPNLIAVEKYLQSKEVAQ